MSKRTTSSSKKYKARLAAGTILLASIQCSYAANPNGESLSASQHFQIENIRISGSQAFTEAQLLQVIQDAIGKEYTQHGLNALGDRLTEFYRNHGYGHAHAILPPQSLNNGTVHFFITTSPTAQSATAIVLNEPASTRPIENPINPVVTPLVRQDPVSDLLAQAKLWQARRRPDLAKKALEKLFLINNNQPDGLAELAELQLSERKMDEALKSLARLKQVQPNHPAIPRLEAMMQLTSGERSRLMQINTLDSTGHSNYAATAFSQLFPNGPPNDEIKLEYLQILSHTNKGWSTAHNGLTKMVKDNPSNIRFKIALAEMEVTHPPINRNALQVLIHYSDDPAYGTDARSAWKKAMMHLSPSASNTRLLQQFLEHNPSDAAVRERLASFERTNSNYRQMLASPVYRARVAGLSQLGQGDLDSASKKFELVLHSHPHDVTALGGMGKVRLRQGRHAEAQAYFEQALRYDHRNTGKWRSLVRTAKFWGLIREASVAQDAGKLSVAEKKLTEAQALNPGEPYTFAVFGDLRVAQGRNHDAGNYYREALRYDSRLSLALNGLAALYIHEGRTNDAYVLSYNLSPDQKIKFYRRLGVIRAGMLRDEAERVLPENRSVAIAKLEQAAQLDPDDPWIRYSLAKLYADEGKPAKGKSLFSELLANHPNDPEGLYAQALFQSSLDDDLAALGTLEHINGVDRSSKISEFQRGLWVDVKISQAKQLADFGQKNQARTLLNKVESAVNGDRKLTAQVAIAWVDIGDSEHAKNLVRSMPASQTSEQHFQYASILARIGDDTAFNAELGSLVHDPEFSGTNAAKLEELRISSAIEASDRLLQQNKPHDAKNKLATALKAHPNDKRLLYADGRASLATNQLADAESDYRHILQQYPAEQNARRDLIDVWIKQGKQDQAKPLLDDWIAKSKNAGIDTQLDQSSLLMNLDEYDTARKKVNSVLAIEPDNGRALRYAEQIARHDNRLDDAIAYLQQSLAINHEADFDTNKLSVLKQISTSTGSTLTVEQASSSFNKDDNQYKTLAELLDQRTSWLSGGIDFRNRTGNAGISQFNSVEIPVELKMPWRGGDQLFFRADAVHVEAGTLNLADTTHSKYFGTQLLCLTPSCQTGLINQSAKGASLAAGFIGNDIQADIGTTPLGFLVWNWVGGITKKGDIGPAYYSAEVSRRPITSSLLSYAGARDPRTGIAWGGVVATGIRLGLGHDDGGKYGFWSSFGLHTLTGSNVQSNNRVQLMGGVYWRAINEDNRLLSIGLTGMDWHFSQNSGEYSFGQGGYYSPQTFQYLSIPVTWAKRYARLSYMIRGSVSTSWSQTSSSPYFPTNSALQAQAVANGLNAFYSASSGPGSGYSLGGSFEYQLTPQLFAGGVLDIQRSQYYAPNHVMFYVRYAIDHAAAKPVPLQPEPIVPYSQF
jgi:predicted Zn-dependent protease